MRNVPIEGGRPAGAPADWNEAERGPCLTISVLRERVDNVPYCTTAWRPGPEELDALAKGGNLFFSTAGTGVPVMRIWVQDDGGDVKGELTSDVQREAALRAAVLQIGLELQRRVATGPAPLNDLKALDWPELLETIMLMVANVPDNVPPGVHHVPILTLRDIVRGRTKQPNPIMVGEPLDQAAADELSDRLRKVFQLPPMGPASDDQPEPDEGERG